MSVLNFQDNDPTFAEGLASKASPTTGVAENFTAAYKGAQAAQPLAARWYEQGFLSDVIEELEAQTGVSFDHPLPWYDAGGTNYDRKIFKIQTYVRNNLENLKGDFSLLLDPEYKTKIQEEAKQKSIKDIKESEDVYNRAEGFLPTAASYAGALSAEAVDPVNLTLGVGLSPLAFGAKTFAGVMFREALINSTIEAAYQPAVAAWYKELGFEYGYEEFRNAVLLAGAAGAGFVGVIKIGGKTIELTADQLQKGYRALIDSGAAKETDVGRGAEIMYNSEIENAAQNPLDGPNAELEHNARTLETQRALVENVAPKLTDVPQSNIKEPENIFQSDNLDGQVFKFNPDEIQVDAETFQFKAGGDEYGVTERLRDVTVWNPDAAGQVTVYEYANGNKFIADGHQRLGLAKRIKTQDPSQEVILYGRKLREVDGITPQEAMVTAAFKNISEGTGSVTDAAKIFRFSPERVNDPSFPKGSQFVSQARGLANLNNNAFGMVVNEVVQPEYGAIVGRLIRTDADMQNAAMTVLSKTDPSTQFQAESIVRQVIETGVTKETQDSLFGEEVITESLFLERAKVLERAKNQLRKDKSAFQNLVRNADRIEGEGNQLAKDANKQRTIEDGKAIALLQSQANRKGKLSDALSNAASLAKQQGSYGEATRSFLNAVRRAIDEGDFERAEVGDVGRIVDAEPQEIALRNEQDQNNLDMFDDPYGDATTQQSDALAEDIRADLTEPELLQEDLRRLVETGASKEQILSHPAIVTAVETMNGLPETAKRPNFNTDEWYATREYSIGSRIDASAEEALEYLIDGARKLSYVDDGLEYAVNSLRQERKAVIIMGPPASGKSSIANPIARSLGASIVDADEAKKILPEFNNGIGASAVHEESSVLSDLVFSDLMEQGDNLVVPKVGADPDKIKDVIKRLKDNGYEVDLVDMVVNADEAFRRMIARFIATGRLIDPKYIEKVGNLPTETYNILRKEGVADGYSRINNEVAKDAVRPIEEDTRGLLANTDFRLRRSGEPGNKTSARASGAEVIAARAERSESVEVPQLEESLLDAEFPVEQMIDADNNVVARTVTARQLLSEIDQDDAMINRLSRCPI